MSKLKLPKTIKMVITDFDGVITDNCVYIDESGKMSRKLNFKDVMGFSMLKKNGFDIGIISGEKNSAIDILAKRYEIKEVHQNIRKKYEVLQDIIARNNLSQEEYIYIGDDINDYDCLLNSKYKITLNHAPQKLKDIENIQIVQNSCGDGAFREVADCLVG